MSSQADDPDQSTIPVDALLLLNRATLVAHAVRSTIHELNNVLQMIGGSAELLGAAGIPPAASARLGVIRNQAARGHAILEEVGALVRPGPAALQTVDVAVVADRALQMRRYEHRRTGIAALLHAPSGGAPRVRIDPQQLLQVILNLLLNAEQALAGVANASIDVSVRSDDQQVDLTVADNGPGVAANVDVVAPFVTGHAQDAAGLGLTASRLIARQSGGELESIGAPGGGACWRLRLPAAAGQSAG